MDGDLGVCDRCLLGGDCDETVRHGEKERQSERMKGVFIYILHRGNGTNRSGGTLWVYIKSHGSDQPSLAVACGPQSGAWVGVNLGCAGEAVSRDQRHHRLLQLE